MNNTSDSANNLKTDLPICVAIVLCNEVIEDKRTNNKTLVSLFNTVTVLQLPALHPRCFIMASLTNLRGSVPITISIKSPSDREIMRLDGNPHSNDPLNVLDIIIELHGVPLEETGTYFIDVYAGGYPIGERRFNVELGVKDS